MLTAQSQASAVANKAWLSRQARPQPMGAQKWRRISGVSCTPMWSQRISGAAVRVACVQPGAGKYQQVEILISSSNHHIRATVNQLPVPGFLPYRTVPVLACLLQFPAQLRLASQRELQYSRTAHGVAPGAYPGLGASRRS